MGLQVFFYYLFIFYNINSLFCSYDMLNVFFISRIYHILGNPHRVFTILRMYLRVTQMVMLGGTTMIDAMFVIWMRYF